MNLGDIVAERREKTFGSAFGIVEKVSRGRAYVTFDGCEVNTFYVSSGLSCNPFRRRMGWRVQVLDKKTQDEIMSIGFSFGPCTTAQMNRMKATATALRESLFSVKRNAA